MNDPNKHSISTLTRILNSLELAGGEPPAPHEVDEDALWSLIDGDLSDAEEESTLEHLRACRPCRGRALELLAARRAVQAAPGWPLERVRTLRSHAAAPAPSLGTRVIELGRRSLRLLGPGLNLITPLSFAQPVLVRSARPHEAAGGGAAGGGAVLTPVTEGMQFELRFEPAAAPGGGATLYVKLHSGAAAAGCELELALGPGRDEVTEAISLDCLPQRLALPEGPGGLRLATRSKVHTLQAWEDEGGAQ